MYTVGMKDYEGFSGFGVAAPSEVESLNKALTAGYQSPRHDGGGALRVESLEATLKVLTYNQGHIKFWRDIPKMPAYSTSEEYTVQTAYGGEVNLWTNEGETPQAVDASYERRVALVKYLAIQKEVSHQMTLVRAAHGDIIALETQNGAVKLLENLERQLFFGNSSVISQAFDGIDKQITDDSVAGVTNVIDMRGGVITADAVEQASNIVVEGYGLASDLYIAPRAVSDLNKSYYPNQRIALPAGTESVGIALKKITTGAGDVALKQNIFLRSGKNNGVKRAPASATASRAPTAPTVVGSLVASATGSLFTAGDIGAYQYKVTAINRFGESAAAQESGGVTTTAALDSISLVITDGGGSDTATGYRVYRSLVGGAVGSEELIYTVPRVGAAATTTWVDLNKYLPGTSRAFLCQMNTQALSFRQLAPMMKIPLATLGPSIRWMQMIYGVPIVYAPQKMVVFINVKDD